MRASVSSTREPMKPESRPSSEQGLASAVNLAGAFDHEFTQTPQAKHASFGGSLVGEVFSLCISSVCLITLDFPQPNRETARCEQSPKRQSESTSSWHQEPRETHREAGAVGKTRGAAQIFRPMLAPRFLPLALWRYDPRDIMLRP